MSSEKQKFAQRLNSVLDDELYIPEFEQRKQVLAHALDVNTDRVSTWLTGEDFPKTSELVMLSQLLQVRSNWLLLGVGNKQNGADDNVAELQINEPSNNYSNSLSKDAQDLATEWMKLPQQQRDALATLIKTLVIQQSLSDVEKIKETS